MGGGRPGGGERRGKCEMKASVENRPRKYAIFLEVLVVVV